MNKKYLPILKDAQNLCIEQDKSTAYLRAYLLDQLLVNFPNLTVENAREVVQEFLIGERW